MEKTNILIIGGGPAGFTCALSARNTHPQKKINLIRKDKPRLYHVVYPMFYQHLKNLRIIF